MIKRILVGLSGNKYAVGAINQAIAIAMVHDAEVAGVSVEDQERLATISPMHGGSYRYTQDLIQERETKAKEQIDWEIREFCEACIASGVRYRCLREKGEPFSIFSKMSRYHDLMVFGMRSVFEHDVVNDPKEALMELVKHGVRPMIATAEGVGPIRRVLIAYSGSIESANSMKQFVQLRLWNDIQIRIVTFEERRPEARQLLEDAASYCSEHQCNVDTDLVSGYAKKELVKYAENWGADLIVAGNSAKNLLQRQFFGDTAINLIEQSNRPLFLSQ